MLNARAKAIKKSGVKISSGCLVGAIVFVILTGLLLPWLSRPYEDVRKTQCRSNLRQIGLAMKAYAADNGGYLPPIVPEAFAASKESGVPAGSYVLAPTDEGHIVKSGLGFLWENYLAGKEAQILYCPSYSVSSDKNWIEAFRYDREEPFWSANAKIVRGNDNGKGDAGWDNVHGEVISNYTLRPVAADSNWTVDKMAKKAVASDVVVPGPKGPAYSNHIDSYSLLFGDGNVRTYYERHGEVAKRLARAGSVNEGVLKVFEELFDPEYSNE